MITILILAGIYALSFYGAYKFVQKNHYREDGYLYGVKPDIVDVMMTIVPFLNSILAIVSFISNCEAEITFFKPKKQ